MKNLKLIGLSAVALSALLMIGCGSSNNTVAEADRVAIADLNDTNASGWIVTFDRNDTTDAYSVAFCTDGFGTIPNDFVSMVPGDLSNGKFPEFIDYDDVMAYDTNLTFGTVVIDVDGNGSLVDGTTYDAIDSGNAITMTVTGILSDVNCSELNSSIASWIPAT